MIHGPSAGLELLETLDADPRLARHHRLAAVRGHLHERAGNTVDAITYYRSAATSTSSIPERNYLLLKAARLGSSK
jgi:predicted RNA polymerase sigma factor